MSSSDLAPGLLLLMLGMFVILRSVNQDQTGRTLVDRILGNKKPAPAAAAASGSYSVGAGAKVITGARVSGRDVNAKATTGARAPGVAGHLGGDLVVK